MASAGDTSTFCILWLNETEVGYGYVIGSKSSAEGVYNK